jgi:hypothetical protein
MAWRPGEERLEGVVRRGAEGAVTVQGGGVENEIENDEEIENGLGYKDDIAATRMPSGERGRVFVIETETGTQ